MIPQLYPAFKHWDKQTVWIYSDPHFGDAELRAGVPGRPTDEEQVRLIKSKVGRKDTLIILGDIGDIQYVKQLRGYKVLIQGNHDVGATNYKRDVHQDAYPELVYDKEDAFADMQKKYPDYYVSVVHKVDDAGSFWLATADNQLFDEVYEGPVMVAERLMLSHEPLDISFAFNIHGHDHVGHPSDGKHFNVCSDVIGYIPVNFNQFFKSGAMAKIPSVHRITIDKATVRKKKRKGQKIYG